MHERRVGEAVMRQARARAGCSSRRAAARRRGATGPFDIPLFNTPKAPTAQGHARLVFAQSPFGIAVTADGHASYDVQIDASGLPDPSTLGAYTAYVAWAATHGSVSSGIDSAS